MRSPNFKWHLSAPGFNCLEIKKHNGSNISGFYNIWLNHYKKATIKVFCDMVTDGGNFWISYLFEQAWVIKSISKRISQSKPTTTMYVCIYLLLEKRGKEIQHLSSGFRPLGLVFSSECDFMIMISHSEEVCCIKVMFLFLFFYQFLVILCT